jgi:glycosyltransferase involved in cell wall biosynthesis
LRLGVYADLLYHSDGSAITTDRAFIRFISSLPPRVDEIIVFGRLAPEPGRAPYALPGEHVRFVSLPYYPRVDAVGQLVRVAGASCATFAAELDRVDAVWVFGPHPLALPFAWIAHRRRKPLVLGVRQDYPQYIAERLPGRSWMWAIPAAHALELSFRRLARTAPTIAVGDDLAGKYAHGAPVLAASFSLVPRSELVSAETALARSWDRELRLLSVGRLDPEKNPLLLPEILAGLRAQDSRWRLAALGEGRLRGAVEERAGELGVAAALELPGYVPNGPKLWERYRASHAFLHVSLTEGLPQVLVEAQAAGLPIVATDVGGVAGALDGGSGALLVLPRDARAAVDALTRLAQEPELRRRLIEAGLRRAARETMEAQLDRVAEFIRAQLARGSAARP